MAVAYNLGGTPTYGTVNQVAHTQTLSWNCYISTNTYYHTYEAAYWGWGYAPSPSYSFYADKSGFPPGTKYFGTEATNADCDDDVYLRGYGEYYDDETLDTTKTVTAGPYQTYAADPTIGTPSAAADSATQITVSSISWIPATKNTGVSIILQYKLTSEPTVWTDHSTLQSGQTGYSTLNPSNVAVTGLTPDTSYDFRLKVNRAGTANPTTLYYGTTVSESTLPDVPEVTTSAATNVTAGVTGVPNDGTATLNGTVDRNGKTDLEWRFAYGLTSGALDLFTTWTASTSEPETVQAAITDLTESSTYYFELQVRWNSGVDTDEGSELSFSVPADPLATAVDEAQMFVYEYDAIQGEDKTIYFSFRDVASSSSDRFISDTVLNILAGADGGGDVLIYIDGAIKATNSGKPDNNITRVGLTELFSLVVDGTTELTGEDVMIQFVDLTGSAVFRDFSVHIRTIMRTSQFHADASQGLTNQSGFIVKGQGSGHGLQAVAGATGKDIYGILGNHVLASGAVTSGSGTSATLTDGFTATNDLYNGDVILFYAGTGAGQSREITDFTSGGVATLSSALISALDATTKYIIVQGARALEGAQAEITDVPTDNSTIKQKIQFIFQRLAFRIKQTATAQTMYESDGTTVLGTRAVSDDGSTQDIAAIQDP